MREPSIEIVIGFKGVGKTYTTREIVNSYIMNDPGTGRVGRPVLVFDVNGEYEDYKAIDYDVLEENEMKRVANILKITGPGKYRIVAYKKDRTIMNPNEKYRVLIDLSKHCRGMLLILEDINSYVLSNIKVDVIAMLIGVRHLGTDLIIHYQSLHFIPPRIWANMNFLRWHKQSDDIAKYLRRLDGIELFKIGECISERQYNVDPHYFFWIDKMGGKFKGVDELIFERACLDYLAYNPGALKKSQILAKMERQNAGESEIKGSDSAVRSFIEKKKKQYL
jgi:hypothetical protein